MSVMLWTAAFILAIYYHMQANLASARSSLGRIRDQLLRMRLDEAEDALIAWDKRKGDA